jgi:predicted GNAT superfamily acetyltransferase
MSITIRDLTSLADYEACVALQEETWGPGFSERVPLAILRVAQKIGGVTAGAFDEYGAMVGFVFGMTGVRNGRIIHWSDMLAVRAEHRGHHLGEQLKHYQAEQARAVGALTMRWTFDPLVARNAHLNINKLGATPVEYLSNLYGEGTGSALHGVLPTDRLVPEWDLINPPARPPRSVAAADTTITMANPLDAYGLPVIGDLEAAPAVRVQIPRDVATVHADGREVAMRWRLTVRDALVHYMGHGYRVTRFGRGDESTLPYYVLVATPPAERATP